MINAAPHNSNRVLGQVGEGKAALDPTRIVGTPQTAQVSNRVEAPARLELGFKLNQILNGTVLEAIGRRTTIALEGRQIVAQSSAALQAGDQVQLLVKDISNGKVVMQVLARQSPSSVQSLLPQEFANFLASMGLEGTDRNQRIVQQFMVNQLPVDGRSVEDLGNSLARLGAQSEGDVRAGVFLKAMGLPINRVTLDLASHQIDASFKLGESLANIDHELDSLYSGLHDLPAHQQAPMRDLLDRFKQLLAEQPLQQEEKDVLSAILLQEGENANEEMLPDLKELSVPTSGQAGRIGQQQEEKDFPSAGLLREGESNNDEILPDLNERSDPTSRLAGRIRQLVDDWGTAPENKLVRLQQFPSSDMLIKHDLRSQLGRLVNEINANQRRSGFDPDFGKA